MALRVPDRTIRDPRELLALRGAMAMAGDEGQQLWNQYIEGHPTVAEGEPVLAKALAPLTPASSFDSATNRYRMFGASLRFAEVDTSSLTGHAAATPESTSPGGSTGTPLPQPRVKLAPPTRRGALGGKPSWAEGNRPIYVLDRQADSYGVVNHAPDPGLLIYLGASDFPQDDPYKATFDYLASARKTLYDTSPLEMSPLDRLLRNVFMINETGMAQDEDGNFARLSDFDPLSEATRQRIHALPTLYELPHDKRIEAFAKDKGGLRNGYWSEDAGMALLRGAILEPLVGVGWTLAKAIHATGGKMTEGISGLDGISPIRALNIDAETQRLAGTGITNPLAEWLAAPGRSAREPAPVMEWDIQNYRALLVHQAEKGFLAESKDQIASIPDSELRAELEEQQRIAATWENATHNHRNARILQDIATIPLTVGMARAALPVQEFLLKMAGIASRPVTRAGARGMMEAATYSAVSTAFEAARGGEPAPMRDFLMAAGIGVPLEMALPLGKLAYYDLRGAKVYRDLADATMPSVPLAARQPVYDALETRLRDVYAEASGSTFREALSGEMEKAVEKSARLRGVADNAVLADLMATRPPVKPSFTVGDAAFSAPKPVVLFESATDLNMAIPGVPPLPKFGRGVRVKLQVESLFDAFDQSSFGRKVNKHVNDSFSAMRRAMNLPEGTVKDVLRQIAKESPTLSDLRRSIKTVRDDLAIVKDGYRQSMDRLREQFLKQEEQAARALSDASLPQPGRGRSEAKLQRIVSEYYLTHPQHAAAWRSRDLMEGMVDAGVDYDVMPIVAQLDEVDKAITEFKKQRGSLKSGLARRTGDEMGEPVAEAIAAYDQKIDDLLQKRGDLAESAGLSSESEVRQVLRGRRQAEAYAERKATERAARHKALQPRAEGALREANRVKGMQAAGEVIDIQRSWHEHRAMGESVFTFWEKQAQKTLDDQGRLLVEQLETAAERAEALKASVERRVNRAVDRVLSTAASYVGRRSVMEQGKAIKAAAQKGGPSIKAVLADPAFAAVREEVGKIHTALRKETVRLRKEIAYNANMGDAAQGFHVRDSISKWVKREVKTLADLTVPEAEAVTAKMEALSNNLAFQTGKRVLSFVERLPRELQQMMDAVAGVADADVSLFRYAKDMDAEAKAAVKARRDQLEFLLREHAIRSGVPVEVALGRGMRNVGHALSLADAKVAQTVSEYAAATPEIRNTLLVDDAVVNHVWKSMRSVVSESFVNAFRDGAGKFSPREVLLHWNEVARTRGGMGVAGRARSNRMVTLFTQIPQTISEHFGAYGIDSVPFVEGLRAARGEVAKLIDPIRGGILGQALAQARQASRVMEDAILSSLKRLKTGATVTDLHVIVGTRMQIKWLETVAADVANLLAAEASAELKKLTARLYEGPHALMNRLTGGATVEGLEARLAEIERAWQGYFDEAYDVIVTIHKAKGLPVPKRIDVGYFPLSELPEKLNASFRKRLGASEALPPHWSPRKKSVTSPTGFDFNVLSAAERYTRNEVLGLVLRDSRVQMNNLLAAASLAMNPRDARAASEAVQDFMDAHLMRPVGDISPRRLRQLATFNSKWDMLRLVKMRNIVQNMSEVIFSGAMGAGLRKTFWAGSQFAADIFSGGVSQSNWKRIAEELTEAGVMSDAPSYMNFTPDRLAEMASTAEGVGSLRRKAFDALMTPYRFGDEIPRIVSYRAYEVAVDDALRAVAKKRLTGQEAWNVFAAKSGIDASVGKAERLHLQDLFEQGNIAELKRSLGNNATSSIYVDYGPGGRAPIYRHGMTKAILPYSSYFFGRATFLADAFDEAMAAGSLPGAMGKSARRAAARKLTRIALYDAAIGAIAWKSSMPVIGGVAYGTYTAAQQIAAVTSSLIGVEGASLPSPSGSSRTRIVSPTLETEIALIVSAGAALNSLMLEDGLTESQMHLTLGEFAEKTKAATPDMRTEVDIAKAYAQALKDAGVNKSEKALRLSGKSFAQAVSRLSGVWGILEDAIQNAPNAAEAGQYSAEGDVLPLPWALARGFGLLAGGKQFAADRTKRKEVKGGFTAGYVEGMMGRDTGYAGSSWRYWGTPDAFQPEDRFSIMMDTYRYQLDKMVGNK